MSAPTEKVALCCEQGRQGVLAGEQHERRRLTRPLGKDRRQPADRQPHHRRQQDQPALDVGPQMQAQPPKSVSQHGGRQSDDDRPAELGDVGVPEMGQVRNGEREGAMAGPAVEPDEDEGSDTSRQQPGHQHQSHHRATQPRCLHQEEGAGDRGAEQRADGGETAGRGHYRDRLRRGIPFGGVHDESGQPATDGDQGRFWSEHRSKGQGRQGGQHHPGQLDRQRCPSGLEAVGRRVPAPARQVPDGGADQHAGDADQRDRPPDRRPVKAQRLAGGSRIGTATSGDR